MWREILAVYKQWWCWNEVRSGSKSLHQNCSCDEGSWSIRFSFKHLTYRLCACQKLYHLYNINICTILKPHITERLFCIVHEREKMEKKCSTVLIQLWINYILFYFSLEKVTRAMFMFRRRTNLNSDLLLCIWWTSLRLQVFVYCCHWLLGISTFSWTNKVGFTMTSFLPLLLFSYQIPWCINAVNLHN